MERSDSPPRPTIDQLRHVATNFPMIDNHAHNLILPTHQDTVPFESITSEAQGRALRDTFKSLSHLRAAGQLRELYECGDDAGWEDILEQRIEWLHSGPERITKRCFEGVHTLLIDDGLAGPGKVHPYDWHDQYTKAPSKRIVRIETVAERLMESILQEASESSLGKTTFYTDTWVTFSDEFEREIQEAIQDHEVAGFKTVICYRTGLDIEPEYERAAREVGHPFERYVKGCVRKRDFRIERKALNDYLVLRTLEVLSERLPRSGGLSKPLQFHTGLGDNDIDLRESNPAFLQPLVENYSDVPFVLLHSAYPYTREAGYLATVYKHVYLDIGEVFPMVSRDGQSAILRQALELAPGSKLLYSSDGHWFPETYWLANKQFREVWLEVLIEYIKKGDLTPHQAIGMTKDILFNNSNMLYDLGCEAEFNEISPVTKQITFNPRMESETLQDPVPVPMPQHANTASVLQNPALSPTPGNRSAPPYEPPSFPPPPKSSQVYDIARYDTFMKQNPDIKFVYVQWVDYMATMRARIVPIKEFGRLIREGERIAVTKGCTGILQNDELTPVVNTTGQILIEPDLRSLRRTHKKDSLVAATVFSYWRSQDGMPLDECPRHSLESLISNLQYNHDTTLLCGFEIEVTFLSRSTNTDQLYEPLTKTHAWSTLSAEQWLQLPFLAEIVLSLEEMGIDIQQFHAESGLGQYEFVLPPQPPLAAVDTLIQVRQVVAQIAAVHGLRATLHPKPFKGIGTAAHAHISLHPPDKNMQFFVGGVLRHLPSLCAFTMPEAESYGRVVDDHWCGGTWVSWGTQNRETPLRRIEDGRWEIRCLDGMANMYIALAAIIAAGLIGLSTGETEFAHKDLPYNPSRLDEEERAQFGVVKKMPASIEEALDALRTDTELNEAMAHGLVHDFVVMKQSEQRMLGRMPEAERRVWLIERY